MNVILMSHQLVWSGEMYCKICWGSLSDRRSSAVTGEAIPGGAGQFSRCCSLQSWGVPSKMGCVNLCSLRMGPPCRHPSMVRRHVSLGVRTLPQALQSPNNYRPHQQPLYQLAQSLPKKADETVHPSLSCTTNPHIIPASNFYLHGRLAMTISWGDSTQQGNSEVETELQMPDWG